MSNNILHYYFIMMATNEIKFVNFAYGNKNCS